MRFPLLIRNISRRIQLYGHLMLIMAVGIVFYCSKWSWKIIDYEYGCQIPYLASNFEIFIHLWSEKFLYEKSYTKNLIYFGMELSIYLINKTCIVTSQKNGSLTDTSTDITKAEKLDLASLILVHTLLTSPWQHTSLQ